MALGDVIASLAISLSLETAALEKGADLAEKRMNQMRGKLEKFGDRMSGIGKKMSLAITAPLAAFGVSAFNAATDAAELQSAFDQTFGKMSASMNKWAEDTGNAMGRSTQEMQKAANTFGIFFNTAVDPQKAAEMSQTFAELAQDLGSFYNVDTQTAIEKLRSGLSGESEPLRDFGVFLTEANVKAKALEMGLTGVGNELTEQEKILARYQLIMAATANAQGDVARTSDGTANQLRKSQAAWEELQVTIGTKLLPVITPLIEKLAAALEWFTNLPKPVQNTVLVVGALAAALGPVLTLLGSIITISAPLMAFLTALGPVLSIVGKSLLLIALNPAILGLAAVIAGIYLAWKNWDKIEPIIVRLYTAVKTWVLDKLNAVWDGLKKKIDFVKGLFFGLYDAVVGHSYIPDMVDGIAAQMARLESVMVAPVTKATSKSAKAFRDMAGEIKGLLDRLFPEAARGRQFRADEALLDKAGLTDEQLKEARRRLGMERWGTEIGPVDFGGKGGPLDSGLDNLQQKLEQFGKKGKETTTRVAKSFKDMADETLGAMNRLANSIKGGGFLGILEAVIGLGLQLGSIGAFGKTIAGRLNKTVPHLANGTGFHSGGLALVGERGPELVSMPRGSRVTPNHKIGGTVNNYFNGNLMTPEFWAQINAGDVGAARAGAQGGVAMMNHRQSRRLA